jgi:Tol biopolymer transport system component
MPELRPFRALRRMPTFQPTWRNAMVAHLAAATLLLASAAPAAAQLAADASWRTLESQHFRITYEEGLEEIARHAATSAERAHAALAVFVAQAPRGTIDIVVADNVDFTNGFATPFPANRVVIYVKPPVDVLELQYTADWVDLVIIHELAHIFHLDVAGGLGNALRTVFGRLPAPWPFFPAIGTPGWSIEGLATGVESALTGYGRVHGSYHEMVVRTAVLQGRMDDIHRLGAASPIWPGGARIYIYGSLFMDYLTRRYGPDATARVVRSLAGSVIPPPLWFGGVARRALGVTFAQAYADWERELGARYTALASELAAAGLTRGEPLTHHGAYALHPRFSPDGSIIAYAANDWRSAARLRAIDAQTGVERWSRRLNDLTGLAWLPDGSVITSQLDYVDAFRIYSDVHVIARNGARRITRNARMQDPDVSRDGRHAVAIENSGGSNRIVTIDLASDAVRPILDYDPDVHWAMPRLSPDGSRIAVGRWTRGGAYDIVVLDTLGRTLLDVTRGAGISAAPVWSPDGNWILFWSDRTGIPNIYASEIAQMSGDFAGGGGPLPGAMLPPLRQVTNVLTGAYFPDVSPDGRWIAFSAYHHDGFRIERMPFDPAQWRDPMPEHFAEIAGERGAYETTSPATPFTASVASAAAMADTVTSDPGRYRPLRHLRPYGWLPVYESDDAGRYFGFWSYGADLVGRHAWSATASLDPGSGRTQAGLRYDYRGLPALPAIGLHPRISLFADRDWSVVLRDPPNSRQIDEREDRGEVALSLDRPRFRSRIGLTLGAEVVRRARHLQGFPAGTTLRDPDDDLVGLRASTFYARFVSPPRAISRENGVLLQVNARQRWDRNVRQATVQNTPVTFDGGYSELTSWNAAYLALPLPGFARHVIAARASGLLRDGPGAGLSSVGGVGGSAFGLGLPGVVDDIGGTARLLPVRGFEPGTRQGTRAWTASAEYRLPVALVGRGLPPLPLFVDRISAATFLDAGHAWCDEATAQRLATGRCSTSASDTPLLAAGAEATFFLGAYGFALPLRFGAAVPLHNDAPTRQLRGYILISTGF